MRNYLLLFLAICMAWGCKPTKSPATSPISIVWEMGENGIERHTYENTFYLKNVSDKELGSNWVIYFNQLPATPIAKEGDAVQMNFISSTYFSLTPTEHYTPIAPGETLTFVSRCRGNIIKEGNAPRSGYIVLLDEDGNEVGKPMDVTIEVTPFSHEGQWSRKGANEPPYPYGDIVYDFNEQYISDAVLAKTAIFPNMKEAKLRERECQIGTEVGIYYWPKFQNEAEYLQSRLKALGCTAQLYTAQDAKAREGITSILLQNNRRARPNTEAYELGISPDVVLISTNTEAGMFYGIQSLLALIENQQEVPCAIPCGAFEDYPDLRHRGVMLDMSRNFIQKEEILKLIDLFASYKLNVLHMHLSDDEGWRLEVPGLEELTTVGAHRGHTLTELDHMRPQYNGGWDVNNPDNTGCGFYSRQDFIDILQYAASRHIRVLPEFDLPGHSRAAIKAMEARYHIYKDTDPAKATEYLLSEAADSSEYKSVQYFNDNVVNVALPSTYKFVYKVIDELEAMYKEAGLTLPVLHLGGDEVPHGCWEKSPACIALMEAEGLTEVRELKDYFIEQILSYMDQKNIQLAAWQEIVLLPDEKTINPKFADRNVLSYCWTTQPHTGREELPYNLANAGLPVILGNVSNLYLDMSYNKHQSEPGLYWGGFVDEFVSYDTQPFDIYKSLRKDRKGEPVDLSNASDGKVKLRPEAREQIVGIQGMLWAETMRGAHTIERSLLPKMFGLVERGWNAEPSWNRNGQLNEAAYWEAVKSYNQQIVENELPRLHKSGFVFRIAQPGIKRIDGKVHMNSYVKGVTIRYTLDGSEPTANSPEYTTPFDSDAQLIKAKSFAYDLESVTTFSN